MEKPGEIREKLEELEGEFPVPEAIADWELDTGFDATGDRAVWVWGILRDEYIERVWKTSFRDEVRARVRRAVQELLGQDVQVYVRFRGQSENAELHEEGWAV